MECALNFLLFQVRRCHLKAALGYEFNFFMLRLHDLRGLPAAGIEQSPQKVNLFAPVLLTMSQCNFVNECLNSQASF